jgi:hypothetical protein
VHFIISWLLRQLDIPHKIYGVWINGQGGFHVGSVPLKKLKRLLLGVNVFGNLRVAVWFFNPLD